MGKGLSISARRDAAIALGIALLATLPFLAAGVSGEFLVFDDPVFVTANPEVLRGLSFEGVRWAFTTFHFTSWFPLTWLSHMLDVSLFGLDARGHHAVNIFLHALNAGLLFLILRRMTGAVWRSAFVAALFGVHPLHVESVAWVSERKDLLAGLFFMLVLLAWERYIRRGGGRRYLTAIALFAVGLTAKPMLVTLPFLLLLLDIWPLERVPLPWGERANRGEWSKILLEKVPFLALAAASCAVTLTARVAEGPLRNIPGVGQRSANAIVSYAAYFLETFWPTGLGNYYPFPSSPIPWPKIAGSALLLLILSLGVFLRLRRQPWLAVGWSWYIGLLVPVSGIVFMGDIARADRWTYLPLIGLFVALTWLAAGCLPRVLRRPPVLGPLACGVVAACLVASTVQAGYWRNSETIARRTLAVTKDNWLMNHNLGVLLGGAGRHEEALRYYLEVNRVNPDHADTRYNLGNSLSALGRYEEAIAQYREAVRIRPDYFEAYNNLGNRLAALGRYEAAAAQFRMAIRLKPDSAQAHNNLGLTLANMGRVAEASQEMRMAKQLAGDPSKK